MTHRFNKTSLGELQKQGFADVQTGPFGTVLKASEFSDIGVPVISTGEIREGFVQLSHRTPFVPERVTNRLPQFVLQLEDIVFGRKGAIDRNAIIKKNQVGWFLGSDGIRLRLSKEINSKFISYQLRQNAIGKWLLQNSTGSTMPSLNQKILDRLPLWLPSINIQDDIADILTSLDAKIEVNKKINHELEAMAKTLYDYWFVQFDFPDANGKPYKSSGGKMVFNKELKREIPEGWEDGVLTDIANITMGQSPSGSSYNEDGIGTVFYQGSTDFGSRFPTVRKYTTEPSRMAEENDILLSVRAPVGTLNQAMESCCIGRGLAALREKEGSISFLWSQMEYFKQIFDRRNTSGTTFGSITKVDLFNLKLCIPNKDVLKQFKKIADPFHDKIVVNSKENQKLSELRDWLLPMLMNGQVTVGEAEQELGMVAEENAKYDSL
ncbi:restriction endonuclease subunit S [Zobellia barbeyronii]|uniref:Restriction endonuclease subunit S n=1 Tax=Zobellia barbeyronii TaxID=2748009 RepID=A0ABS5WBN7_9FLAO|nr:restriction endonuclease subunit S [Zobellia barbeyronii]MBT2160809.1 restriction endonuclease subunit S [Zobellia barbeyronii]